MNDFFIAWHNEFMNADRVPEALAALLITVIIGMITGPTMGNAGSLLWQPLDLMFGRFGEKMDKAKRSRGDLMFRGLVFATVLIAIGAGIGEGLEMLSHAFPQFSIGQTLCLSILITSGTIWFVLLKLYFAIEKNKAGEKINQGAFYAIARSTRINLSAGDDFGITRAAIGLSVRSFDKNLVAPILWYIIGGFTAASVYTVLSFIAWRHGKQGLGSGFAAVPLALEKLMGIIPSLYSAILITLASTFTPTAKIHKGIASWLGHKSRAPYEQGGAPVSALAWALNISIGGAVQDLSGQAIKADWIGPEGATAQLDHKHLRRALYINVIAHILFVASLLGLYMWASIL